MREMIHAGQRRSHGGAVLASGSPRRSPTSLLVRALLVPLTCVLVGGTASAFDAVTLEDYSGAELFDRFCASCHGSEARGDGPVSRSLNVAVPDLTMIVARYGQFPAATIRDIIDGRGVDAHGTRTMPVWGYEFWVEEGGDVNAQRAVRDAITRLVEHLRSVQRGESDGPVGVRETRQ